ncbi:immunity 50 family protein [Paenibacillus durus]|uniref:Immunity protein 50 n=1 Tax=Paenibacillus durus ATCC 35681 TaxID=1333534 RepID=A0A0F7FF93_PAEDU|nr:immunity 50 family protein [Paenibacillus durus]AKG37598.1 hypothetical protein VK70_04520 [Paenibacillus durus ATCC 35681]
MLNQARIMNPESLVSIFGKVPEFCGSELLDVQLRRDGPTLFVRFMTNEPVLTKPKRWDKWDVIYIEFSFFAVRDLIVNGLGTENIVKKFEITDGGEGAILQIICENPMQITCSFDWARVEQISPGLVGLP